MIKEEVLNAVPDSKLFRRGKEPEKKNDKGQGGPSGYAGGGNPANNNLPEQRVNIYPKKFDEYLLVPVKSENPNGLNFQELYQENLPPEAKELDDYVKKFKDKDTSKDKEILKYQNNAREKLRRVQNLVPENKIQISALRLEEGDEFGDRRGKNMFKAMNVPQISQQRIKEESS